MSAVLSNCRSKMITYVCHLPSSRSHRLDLRQLLAERTGGHLQVVVVLEVEPELRCGAERLAQPQRGIGSDSLSGTRNSSRRTSPGCMGASFLVIAVSPREVPFRASSRLPVSQYDISFIISRLRSTKSLCHEGYVVGPAAAYAQSVRLL